MPETPTKEAMAAAVRIMQDVFLWNEERCLTPEGRAAIGEIASRMDAYCDSQRNLDYILVANERDAAVARAEAAEGARLELNNRCLAAEAERVALEQRVALLENAWAESWDCSADPGHDIMHAAIGYDTAEAAPEPAAHTEGEGQ